MKKMLLKKEQFSKKNGENSFLISQFAATYGASVPGGGMRPLGSWNAREDGGRVRRGEKHECN